MNAPVIPNLPAARGAFVTRRDGCRTLGPFILLLVGELAGGALVLALAQFGAFAPAHEGRAEARLQRGSKGPLLDVASALPQQRRLEKLSMRDLNNADRGGKR